MKGRVKMRSGRSTIVLVVLVAFMMTCVASVTILELAGKPVDTMVALISGALVPTVVIIVNAASVNRRLDSVGADVAEAKQQAADNGSQLESVKHAVNGNLDAKLLEMQRLLLDRLAE